jgi:hypothetical protein
VDRGTEVHRAIARDFVMRVHDALRAASQSARDGVMQKDDEISRVWKMCFRAWGPIMRSAIHGNHRVVTAQDYEERQNVVDPH